MAGATRPSSTGAHNTSQFVLCRAFDRSRALWPYETDDELSERLWVQARASWSRRRYVRCHRDHEERKDDANGCDAGTSSSATATVSTFVFSVERRYGLEERRRRTERTLLALMAGMRNQAPRWRPSRHIATSLVCSPPRDVDECLDNADGRDCGDRYRALTPMSHGFTVDDCHLRRYHEAKLLHTLYEWLVKPVSKSGVSVDSAAAAVSGVEALYSRRRLLDSLCLDTVLYSVSPGCNRDIAEAANRNARVRDEFAKVITNLRLDTNTPTISNADLDTELPADGNDRAVERRIVSTVSRSLRDARGTAQVEVDGRDRVDARRSVAVSDGTEARSSRSEADRIASVGDAVASSSRDLTVRRNDEDSRARSNGLSIEAAVAAIAWNLDDRAARSANGTDPNLRRRGVKTANRSENDSSNDEDSDDDSTEPPQSSAEMSDRSRRGDTAIVPRGIATLRRFDNDAENFRRSADRSIEARCHKDARNATTERSDRRENGTTAVQRMSSQLDGSVGFRREHGRVLTDTTTRRERWSAYDDVWRDVDRDLEEHLTHASMTIGSSVGAKRTASQKLDASKRARSRANDERASERGSEALRAEGE